MCTKENRGNAGVGKGALTQMLQCGRQGDRSCVDAAEGFLSDRFKAFGQNKTTVAERTVGKRFVPDGLQIAAPAEIRAFEGSCKGPVSDFSE